MPASFRAYQTARSRGISLGFRGMAEQRVANFLSLAEE